MSWKRAAFAMVLALPLLGLFVFGLRRGDPRLIASPLVDQPAPEFALPVLDFAAPAGMEPEIAADTLRLADLKGQVVVLNFFASWCVPCRVEHGALTRTAQRYRDRDVQFLGVVYNDTPAAIRNYLSQLGGQNYPALMDPGQRVAIEYGLVGVPETFFIDQEGVVRSKIFSAVTDEQLVQEIDALLDEPTAGADP